MGGKNVFNVFKMTGRARGDNAVFKHAWMSPPVNECSILSCTSIQAPFWIIIANHFKINHYGVYLIFISSPVSECRSPKLFQLLEQLNEDIILVLPLEAQCKGYCIVFGIFLVGANDSQCEYLQTVDFIFSFDLMRLKSIWPYSYKDALGFHRCIFHGWNIMMKIREEICFIMTRLISTQSFSWTTRKNITSIPMAKIWLMISLAGM